MDIPLDRATVEYIHDVLVSLWLPFDEPVDSAEFRDTNLLESSLGRPFQTFGEQDLFPTIPAKAAALFHALISNHCFRNGNKRTAVIALDFFLTLNNRVLAISNDDMYALATRTAVSKRDGRHPDEVVEELITILNEQSVDVRELTVDTAIALSMGEERVTRMFERVRWTHDKLMEQLKQNGEEGPATRN